MDGGWLELQDARKSQENTGAAHNEAIGDVAMQTSLQAVVAYRAWREVFTDEGVASRAAMTSPHTTHCTRG